MAGKTENVEKENKLCTCGHWASSHDFSHCGECRADDKCGCKSFTEEKKFRDASEYAIFHELRCVDLRLSQIIGYLEKIDLLCRGREYSEVEKMIQGIKTRYEFSWKRYNEIKKAMDKNNGTKLNQKIKEELMQTENEVLKKVIEDIPAIKKSMENKNGIDRKPVETKTA